MFIWDCFSYLGYCEFRLCLTTAFFGGRDFGSRAKPIPLYFFRKEVIVLSKDLILSTRVSAEEKEIIERKALESYRTVSNYLRDCALEKKIVSVRGLDEIAAELRRIGNNINQLTRAVNAGQAYEIDLRRTQGRLGDIWQSLNSLTRAVR